MDELLLQMERGGWVLLALFIAVLLLAAGAGLQKRLSTPSRDPSHTNTGGGTPPPTPSTPTRARKGILWWSLRIFVIIATLVAVLLVVQNFSYLLEKAGELKTWVFGGAPSAPAPTTPATPTAPTTPTASPSINVWAISGEVILTGGLLITLIIVLTLIFKKKWLLTLVSFPILILATVFIAGIAEHRFSTKAYIASLAAKPAGAATAPGTRPLSDLQRPPAYVHPCDGITHIYTLKKGDILRNSGCLTQSRVLPNDNPADPSELWFRAVGVPQVRTSPTTVGCTNTTCAELDEVEAITEKVKIMILFCKKGVVAGKFECVR